MMWSNLSSDFMLPMQAMTLWEVLWAEEYRNEMERWTSATSSGGTAHVMVSAIPRRSLLLPEA